MSKLPSIRISFWWLVVACTFLTDISFCSTPPLSLTSSTTMANLANLNGITETLPAIPELFNVQKTRKRVKIIGFLGKKTDDFQLHSVQVTRRVALGLASTALIGFSGNGVSLAETNKYWIDMPFPTPSVDNKIANEKTGTRSFLKKGLYIANVDIKSRMYRLKKYAFDLLAMEDLIGPDTLNYVQKYLRLKCTSMYYDFDKVITAAPVDDKRPLTDLANRLFDNAEKLEEAARKRNLPQTQSIYQDTTIILQEVMDRMA